MATLTLQTTASADDGYYYPGTFTVSSYAVGYDGDLNHAFARFLNVTIPQGAIITSAKLQYKALSGTTPANLQSTIYANKVAAPTSPTSIATYTGKALTTASVNWDSLAAWVTGNWYDSPEIKTIIQELIDQASWVSGNAILLMHKNRRVASPNGYVEMNGYENGSSNGPKLVITYETTIAKTGSFAMTNASDGVFAGQKQAKGSFAITNSSSVILAGRNTKASFSFNMINASGGSFTGRKNAKKSFASTNTSAGSFTGKKNAKGSFASTNTSSGTFAIERTGGERSAYLVVYDADETVFTRNGLCVLSDCISATSTEELNGAYEIEIEHPLDERDKWLNLETDNIIKADNQLFRIYYPAKTLKGIKINARHIFYDLMDNFLEDVNLTMLNGAGALDWMLTHTQYAHNFRSVSDIPSASTWSFVCKNPVAAIMGTDGIIERIGGELERDNFTINLHQSRGADRGVLVAYRKNIQGIEETRDDSEVVTRLMPIGKDGLMLPTKYVDSPYINNYPHPKVAEKEFSDIDNVTDLAIAANDYILNSKCDIPKFNYKIDFIELTKTEEYKNYQILETVYMADTVTIKHSKLGIDLKAKVIKIVKNLITGRIEKIELGSFKPNISNINKEIQSVKNNVLDVQTAFQTAIENATKLISGGDGGNLIIKQDANGKPIGLLIMDTDSTLTAQNVWQFNMGGLGHSSTGIDGPYPLAITADGSIVATFITSGILNASLLQTGSIVSQDGSINISLATGIFTIGGQTGDVVMHTNASSKWVHGLDYTQADATGLYKYVASTKQDYHYLMETGSLSVGTGSSEITLDPAFKNKNFKVVLSIKNSENPAPFNGETMINIQAEVTNINKSGGKFSMRGWGTWYDCRNLIGDQILGISRAAGYYNYTSGITVTWVATA